MFLNFEFLFVFFALHNSMVRLPFKITYTKISIGFFEYPIQPVILQKKVSILIFPIFDANIPIKIQRFQNLVLFLHKRDILYQYLPKFGNGKSIPCNLSNINLFFVCRRETF